MRRRLRAALERVAVIIQSLARRVDMTDADREMLRRVERERPWYAADGDRTLRLDYDLGPDAVVVDLGGYHGDWAAEIHARFGCRVEVFEPVEEFARRIADRFAANPRISVHPFGLAGRDETMEMTLEEGGSSAVILHEGVPRTRVELRDGARLAELIGAADVDLAKINIEGGEFDLLDRWIETGLLARIRHIQIQFHPEAPGAPDRRDRIRAALAATHDQQWNFDWVWESWTRRAGVSASSPADAA